MSVSLGTDVGVVFLDRLLGSLFSYSNLDKSLTTLASWPPKGLISAMTPFCCCCWWSVYDFLDRLGEFNMSAKSGNKVNKGLVGRFEEYFAVGDRR